LIGLSPNGKYIFKLYFNGCWRRVEIDDTLPTSTNSRLLHVIDRAHPGLLWPALTEKAYLKVRGGYDFPGSNSGTDLAVLSGWIPQQVFLHDADIEPDYLWEEIYEAFNNGNIFLTIGTGKLSRREQKHLGLAADHDYAVLELKESASVREMLIKNPWADGDVWKGASRRKPNPNTESYPSLPALEGSDEMLPGTFWMDFHSVFHHYENLYINWNPGLFNHREDRHFSWNIAERQQASTILDGHPQFTVTADSDGEIWLLLNRHFRTGDYTQATMGKNGYISLYLFARTNGCQVLSNEDPVVRGPFVDSPNTLLRYSLLPNETYTAVIVQQDLPPGKHNFTVSAFSNNPITISEAPSRFSSVTTLTSAWTRSNAGGNSDSATYLSNPQFKITLQSQQHVALILRAVLDANKPNSKDIHVKLLLASSPSTTSPRINRLRPRDIKAHTGDYRLSACVLTAQLPPGTYTLICSTFVEQQYSQFTLDFRSSPVELPNSSSADNGISRLLINEMNQARIEAVPAEGAGRLVITATPVTFTEGSSRFLAPLVIHKMTKMTVILRQHPRQSSGSKSAVLSSLFKISLEQGQGPYKNTVADSTFDDEEFQNIKTGLRIGDRLISPDLGRDAGLWLVIERMAQGVSTEDPNKDSDSSANVSRQTTAESVQVELLVEEKVDIGAWGTGAG
jgi:calpain-7